EVLQVVAIVVPVGVGDFAIGVARAVEQLADEHRRAALGEEEEGKARADNRPLIPGARAGPEAFLWILARPAARRLAGQPVGAFAVPVVGADEAVAGEPADALDAIQVVEGLQRHLELEVAAPAHPAQALFDFLVLGIDAAISEGAVAVVLFAAAVEFHGGDEQTADAGFGHGQLRTDRPARSDAFRVGPRAARLILRPHIELAYRLPDFAVDDGPALLAREQTEHGVLRVRAIGGAVHARRVGMADELPILEDAVLDEPANVLVD